jgi:DNA-binding transcriptional MerR regulator
MKMTTTTKSKASKTATQIPDKTFFRIGEVAKLLGVKTYVLRYWETEFPMVAPQKSSTHQRVYRRAEVETLFAIRKLLYEERYSIAGARKRLGKWGGLGPSGKRSDNLARLAELGNELQQLARTPISRLFHF